MRHILKRFGSVFLALTLALGMFAAMPITAGAEGAIALKATIEGFVHGGTGTLTATVAGNTVTVTGFVNNATNKMKLDIDSGVTVEWKAYYGGVHDDELIDIAGVGTFEVASGGQVVNTGDGTVLFASYSDTTIVVSGGRVEGVGDAIYIQANNSAVNISAGAVISSNGAPVYVTGENCSVTMSGGTMSCLGVYYNAIYIHPASTNTTVNVSGGFVFDNDKDNNGAIRMLNGGTPAIGGSAVVVAWVKPSGAPIYDEGSSTDLNVAPAGASAVWGYSGSASGILYKNGSASGFFQMTEATVTEIVPGTAGPFQVTKQPEDATYLLNEIAEPLQATFEYGTMPAIVGSLDSTAPITVRWYWSDANSNTSRANPFAESTIPYDRTIKHTTTHVPATDAVGVKYYYAVLSYSENVSTSSGLTQSVKKEAVSRPARIEVVEPPADNTGGNNPGGNTPGGNTPSGDTTGGNTGGSTSGSNKSFEVRKTDTAGTFLSGAVLALVPDGSYTQDASVKAHEAATISGAAQFTVPPGYYILSERQAPAGYNATDDKYYIQVTADGVFLINPETKESSPYAAVTFVNKEIPRLDDVNHFAFMQGYPDGDFQPNGNMTRAEAVLMFARLLSKSMDLSVDYRDAYYPDIPFTIETDWYANHVCYMYDLGVLVDYSRDTRFRPDEPVTRAEFATLATHFDDLDLIDTNKFSDVPNSHWAIKYINSAEAKGWITGYPDGTFKPEDFITRAEVVTLVGRMLDRYADKEYVDANVNSLPRQYGDLQPDFWAYYEIMEASNGHEYTKDSGGGSGSEHWASTYE